MASVAVAVIAFLSSGRIISGPSVAVACHPTLVGPVRRLWPCGDMVAVNVPERSANVLDIITAARSTDYDVLLMVLEVRLSEEEMAL